MKQFCVFLDGYIYRVCKTITYPSGHISYIPLSFSDKHVSSTKNTYKWAYERLKEWDRRTRAYNVYPSKNTEIYYFDTAEDILNDFPEEFI